MFGKLKNNITKKIGLIISMVLIVSTIYIPEMSVGATELASGTDAYSETNTDTDAQVSTEAVIEEVAVNEEEELYDSNSLIYAVDGGNNRPSVNYAVHAQSFGWMAPVKDGERAGSIGKSKRVEAISFALNTNGVLGKDGNPITGGIKLRAHVQGIGWQNWISVEADSCTVNGNIDNKNYAGTMGQSKRIEAIEIALTGELAKEYDVLYRVHGQSYGWQSAKSNGETAGSIGQRKRIEAIEIVIVEKNASVSAKLSYSVHSQSYGWMNTITVAPGQGDSSTIAGTIGKSKRLEAMKIELDGQGITGGVEYKAHVQGIGWQNPVRDGAVAGTEGTSKRLEAITIELTGQAASYYDIYYRVHVQNLGWLGWAMNGQKAGTEGGRLRLEAVQIYLVERGGAAPGSTSTPYYTYTGNGWKNAPGELVIKVNKQMNCITVYKGSVPIRAIICSTGHATPIGTFPLKSKWRWKELFGGVYGQYSSHITGQILFHSVPYNSANIYDLKTDYYNKLGQTASMGCIRLTTIDAKWIYDNCPTGTKVVIYNSDNPGPLGKPVAQKLPAGQTWDPTDPLIN